VEKIWNKAVFVANESLTIVDYWVKNPLLSTLVSVLFSVCRDRKVSKREAIFRPHDAIDCACAWCSVAQKMILTVHARTAYPLKSRLGLISMPVYGLNFWSGLYYILGGITSSKDTLDGSLGGRLFVVKACIKVDMIWNWNTDISWAEFSVVDAAVETASNISKVSFLLITK